MIPAAVDIYSCAMVMAGLVPAICAPADEAEGNVVAPHPRKDLPAGTVAGIRKAAKGL
jgi:hypothetical protein